MAMKTSTRSDGTLIVGMKNCNTSHKSEIIFSPANANGEYNLDLEVCGSLVYGNSIRYNISTCITYVLYCGTHEKLSAPPKWVDELQRRSFVPFRNDSHAIASQDPWGSVFVFSMDCDWRYNLTDACLRSPLFARLELCW